MKRNEVVILLHGLGLSSMMMLYLKRGLVHAGFDVINVNYPSRAYNVSDLLDVVEVLIKRECSSCDAYKSVHFVGHSLGGILARLSALNYTVDNLGKCIALGSPNRGSVLAQQLGSNRFIRGYFGPALFDLLPTSPFIASLDALPEKYYVIAGTRSSFTPFGNMLIKPNDGTVIVDEMIPEGLDDSLVYRFYVSHTSMLFSNKVRSKLIEVLMDDI